MSETFTPNDLNQYQSVGGDSFVYDQNGNLRSDGRRAFTYDAFGQLIRVEDAQTSTLLAAYEYDASGRMVARSTPQGNERILYDGPHFAAVLDADTGEVLQQYIFNDDSIDSPLILRTQGQDYYYHLDAQGNVVALANSAASIVERYTYDAYGVPTITDATGSMEFDVSQVGNRLMYKARPYDAATGLYDMRARFYDPGLGRFISADPAGTIDGLNLYAFVGNDPANFSDPSGLGLFPPSPTIVKIRTQLELQERGFSREDALFLANDAADLEREFNGLVGALSVDVASALATGGATQGASLLRRLAFAGVSSATGGTVARTLTGQDVTAETLALDAALGAATLGIVDSGARVFREVVELRRFLKADFGDEIADALRPRSVGTGGVGRRGAGSTVQANKTAGDAVRDAIAARERLANPGVPVRVEESFFIGAQRLERRLDVFVEGGRKVGIESKVGRTSLGRRGGGSRVRQELARDLRLLKRGDLDEIIWEFTPSLVTGKGGPTGPLLEALRRYERLGITIRINE